ncbi:hypothetical protein M9Y10_040784 [Tritrichomonas musculus]|uniref:Uncharacterized protein n=1 Tax=Tritrichomonas musculus TaxID=1915356 RepID=A0ABR2K2M9_9EUKA
MIDNRDEIITKEINENMEEKLKTTSIYQKATLFIFILTLILFYIDIGPPLPPYYSWFKTDDCYSLRLESFSNNNGILNFTFYADETYELPREYLPNIIKIRGYSDIVNVTYFGTRYTSRTQNGSFVNIIVPHHFISSFDFLITCLTDVKLAEFHQNITTIDDYFIGSSKSTQIGPKEELFENVCIEKKTPLIEAFQNDNNQYYILKFFSYLNEEHIPFQFSPISKKSQRSNFRLDFECERHNYFEYTSSRNIKSEKGDYIFSPTLDENLWQLVLFDLPEIENVRVWSDFSSFDLIVPNVTSAASIVKSSVYDLEQIQCFNSITIANFRSNVLVNNDEDNEYIWDVLNQNFSNFREKYVSNYVSDSVKIILISDDPNLNDFKQIIENICIQSSSDCSVLSFNQNLFKRKLNDLTNKASILIGNHITNLAPMVMMNNGTHVVDFSNKRYACNSWARKLAEKFDINYHSYFGNYNESNETCECYNFSKCYPELPEKVEIDDIDSIKNLLLKILI